MTQLVPRQNRLSSAPGVSRLLFFSFFSLLRAARWRPEEENRRRLLLPWRSPRPTYICFQATRVVSGRPIVIHLVATNRLPLNQTSLCARSSRAIGQYLADTRRCTLVSRRAEKTALSALPHRFKNQSQSYLAAACRSSFTRHVLPFRSRASNSDTDPLSRWNLSIRTRMPHKSNRFIVQYQSYFSTHFVLVV